MKYFNFDDRPGKIFSGLEDCRATIVVTEKDTKTKKVIVSKYHRWFSKDRAKLFKDLKTCDWTVENPEEIIPKIGTKVGKRILKKLKRKSQGKILRDFFEADGVKIWYHNAPRYWIHAHTEDYLPKVEYYDSFREDDKTGEKIPLNMRERRLSSHYKPLTFESENSFVVNSLMNSSLFYWWFVVWSDGRDLLAQHIKCFPLDLDNFSENLKKRLKPLINELMRSYDENSNLKINLRSGGYVIKIKEIIPSKSISIIDQIDDVFADYFGFIEEERRFIKEFDIGFRIKD